MATGLTPADFGRDPTAVFVKILQDAREPLTAREIVDAVVGQGIPRPTARAKWKIFQERVVRVHPQIDRPNGSAYRWVAASADDDAKVRAARERQFTLDALRAVAELAAEVEELAYDSGDPDLIVERLRARVRAAALDQLGHPGDEASFDPGRHDVQGSRPAEGATVTVVRPGYAWAENGTPLVLRKALVVAE